MEFQKISPKIDETGSSRNQNFWQQFQDLWEAVQRKDIPDQIKEKLNGCIEEINLHPSGDKSFYKIVRKQQNSIIQILEKELKIVTINYYTYLWMAIGTGGFGLPIGVAFGYSIGNMAMLGIGLPIGVAIGMALGASMDKKAKEQGRQLDIMLKY